MSFVSFQQERERENFFRSSDNLGTLERESKRGEKRESGCKVGTVKERDRGIRKERRESEGRRAVCLNPVGFPSVRIPVLFSEPCGGQCHCVCV